MGGKESHNATERIWILEFGKNWTTGRFKGRNVKRVREFPKSVKMEELTQQSTNGAGLIYTRGYILKVVLVTGITCVMQR